MTQGITAVYRYTWTEYENGWGCRPDGATYHSTKEEAKKYIDEYWARQPKETPYEYSKQNGSEPTLVEVTEEFYNEVKERGTVVLSQATLRKRTVEV